jgi:hypothetical protein
VHAFAPVAQALNVPVEIVGEFQAGQFEFHASRFFQGEAHVLNEMIDKETGIVIVLQDTGREVVERPARRGAATNRLQQCIEIQPGLVSVQQTFTNADHCAGNNDLVAELRMLTGSRAALVNDGFAQHLQQRHHILNGRPVAADHDGQRRIARADITARNRSVDGLRSLCLRRRIDFLRQTRRGRCHVHQNCVLLRTGEHTIHAEIHVTNLLGKADHGERDVRLLGNRSRRGNPSSSFVEQRLRLGLGAIENCDRVTFVQQMAAH